VYSGGWWWWILIRIMIMIIIMITIVIVIVKATPPVTKYLMSLFQRIEIQAQSLV
jgi:hypothetical protein